jgi:transcriptional regulator with XRE-family HTH domain
MTAEQLKELRIEHNLSQEALADLLGYKCKSSISRLESGDRPINPRQAILIKMALEEASK